MSLVYRSACLGEHVEQLGLLSVLDCVGCCRFGLLTDIGEMILATTLVTFLSPGSALLLPDLQTGTLSMTLPATVGTFAGVPRLRPRLVNVKSAGQSV